MNAREVTRSAYRTKASVRGLIRNLKIPMNSDARSTPVGPEIPVLPEDGLSAVRNFRHHRWTSRQSSRPMVSESVPCPLQEPEDQSIRLQWALIKSRFLGPKDDWLADGEKVAANEPNPGVREVGNA